MPWTPDMMRWPSRVANTDDSIKLTAKERVQVAVVTAVITIGALASAGIVGLLIHFFS